MARKLKSDRVLFTATLLLVCASIVMVYSASALVALERFNQPYLFVTKQALWAVLGLAVLAITMRVDYRTYRNEKFVWALLAFNLGVEIAQLSLIAVVIPLTFVMRHSLVYRRWVLLPGSAAVTLIGLAWLVERAFNLKFLPF